MGTAILGQLVWQLPMFIAYLVAMVLAIVYWQRCPTPCLLTLISSGLLLGTAVGQTLLTSYLIHAQQEAAARGEQLASTMAVIGLGGSVVRALAFGLLLAAVFSGRPRVQSPWTE